MAGSSREQLIAALRRADAAGDEAAARAIARRLSAQPKAESKGRGEQLWDATKNVTAGAVFEGLGAIPDAVTEAAAGAMRSIINPASRLSAAGYRAIGAPQLAQRVERNAQMFDQGLSRPMTFRRMGEAAAPVPQDTAGQIARFGGSMIGGAATPNKMLPRAVQPRAPMPSLPRPGNPVVAAGQRQGVPVRKPDADPSLYNKVTKAETSLYGGPRIQRAYKDDAGLIQQRAQSVAQGGTAQDDVYNLGGTIQKDAKDWIESTGKQFGKLYDEVDDLSQGVAVQPQAALQAVDAEIADLTAAGAKTNRAQINYLMDLRDDLMKPGGFTMRQFQKLRSAQKGVIRGDQQLAASDATRRLGNIVSAFSDDASTQLPKPAVDLLKETDTAYAQRQQVITNVLQKHVLGRRNNGLSAEKASDNLLRLTRGSGDQDAVNAIWSVLKPQTQSDIAATRAAGLGVNRGGEFQPGRFATDIEQFPAGIRRTLFGDEGAANLDDLATLARAKSDTMGAFNNSRTGVTVGDVVGKLVGNGGAGLGVGFATGNPLLGAATMAGMEGARYANQVSAAKGLLAPVAEQAAPAMDDIATGLPRLLANPAAADELSGLLSEPVLLRLAVEQRAEEERKKREALGLVP